MPVWVNIFTGTAGVPPAASALAREELGVESTLVANHGGRDARGPAKRLTEILDHVDTDEMAAYFRSRSIDSRVLRSLEEATE
jgi:hypothetical protein